MEDAVDQDLVVQSHTLGTRTITNNASRFDEQATDTVGTTASDYREIKFWRAERSARDARPSWPRVKSLLSSTGICGLPYGAQVTGVSYQAQKAYQKRDPSEGSCFGSPQWNRRWSVGNSKQGSTYRSR